MTHCGRNAKQASESSQRGVVLFVALIVLIVMSLAGLALLRSMNNGVSIAGNVAFKENATSVADRGIEEARLWLTANANTLSMDNAAAGYYSSWSASVDPSTFTWDTAAGLVPYDFATTGNDTQYIIHRLCQKKDLSPTAAGQNCSDTAKPAPGASLEGGNYGTPDFAPPPTPFYRVTARTHGPRNTYSYVQVLLN